MKKYKPFTYLDEDYKSVYTIKLSSKQRAYYPYQYFLVVNDPNYNRRASDFDGFYYVEFPNTEEGLRDMVNTLYDVIEEIEKFKIVFAHEIKRNEQVSYHELIQLSIGGLQSIYKKYNFKNY